MEEKNPFKSSENETAASLNISAKPLAFTIDFSDDKSVNLQRHKNLVEKLKNRHKRGESLSKIETGAPKKQPTSSNSPRKSSLQSDGYFSSDETKSTTAKGNLKRDLSLPLKHINSNKMTQSFPGSLLSNIVSPEFEIKDIPNPGLELVSPLSPAMVESQSSSADSAIKSSEKIEIIDLENGEQFVDGSDFDFDKSDTVSDTGTYTLEADNYSEEQKIRMSIDREFKIESISGLEKTKEYVKNLPMNYSNSQIPKNQLSLDVNKAHSNDKLLSPILSPTQNLSITDNTRIMDEKLVRIGCSLKENSGAMDRGSVISVTSCGVFRTPNKQKNETKLMLTKSEIQVETYVDDIVAKPPKKQEFSYKKVVTPKLSANVINVQNISIKSADMDEEDSDVEEIRAAVKNNGTTTKIPSPIHLPFRPRNGMMSSATFDFSDKNETESYLNSTQSCIQSLQQRILCEQNDVATPVKPHYEMALNNAHQSILKQTSHIRHNSLDGKGVKISNKLEHFQSKNFNIDQTNYNNYNKFSGNTTKIQNSPINSPIRRSSSFSTTKQQNNTVSIKITNVQKELSGSARKIDRNKFGDTTESSSEDDYEKNSKKTLLTNTRYNRAFSLRRGRLESDQHPVKCPKTPEIRRKFPNNLQQPERFEQQRAISVDRKIQPSSPSIQSRYMSNITKKPSSATAPTTSQKNVPKSLNLNSPKSQVISRTDSGRFSMRMRKGCDKNTTKPPNATPGKKSGGGSGRSNSSLTSREVDFQNWKRRKSYDPIKAAAEGKRREMEKKTQLHGIMTQSYNENQIHECDSSPSHSSSVHRSQSFHGTAAMEQLVSSEDEDDMTLSADEGFSPPTPSPCELSPAKMSLRNTCRERILH